MKPKEWFSSKGNLELVFKHDPDEPAHVVFQKGLLADRLPEYYLGRAKTLCRRAGIDLVTAIYNNDNDSRGQIDTWAAIVARVIADNGYQSMKQLNEEIDSLVRNDIRIFKTYGPQGGKEKRNG